MNGYEYILAKQIEWANNRGFCLIGSKRDRGHPTYVCDLNQNLCEPLRDDVRAAFVSADGSELQSPDDSPSKMQAVHSSSASAVKVFQYWVASPEVSVIAAACGLCRSGSSAPRELKFEDKYPVNDAFEIPPNIDVVIWNRADARIQRLAIECKFSEAYSHRVHGGFKERYLTECGALWKDLPNLRRLAESVCPEDDYFDYLHAAQLIKHILGLKRAFGRDGFRLLYLWYDVLGEEGRLHRLEVEEFAARAKRDGVMFHSLTYQALICRLAGELRSRHAEYICYLTERYL